MYKGKKTEEKRRGVNKNQTKISINVSFLIEYSACESKVKNREKINKSKKDRRPTKRKRKKE